MAAADQKPPPQEQGQPSARSHGEYPPVVGGLTAPNNSGQLGFTYTIYRFYDAADRLLYLGESGRVRQRIVDIEVGNPRGLPLGHIDGPKPWWREATRIELEHLPPGTTEAEALVEEARQIALERPVYNPVENGQIDLARQERTLAHVHFEADVATVEHERHDGVVRDLTQVEIESRRAADRLRPGGSTFLDAIPRQRSTGSRRSPTGGGGTGFEGDDGPFDPSGFETGLRRAMNGNDGPGSPLGLAVVAVILGVLVIVALVVSLQAAF